MTLLQEEIQDQDLEEEVAKLHAKAQKKKACDEAYKKSVEEMFGARHERPRRTKPPALEKVGSISQPEAKVLVPPGFTISKEVTWHHRWKICGKRLGGRRSRTFPADDLAQERDILCELLRWAWATHKKVSDDECPWELGGGSL